MYTLSLPINYEDTDAGGVVYYGNYLGYMERARNAYLRSLGLPLTGLSNDHNLVFVVTEVSIRYLAPARLDDEIQVTLQVGKIGAASIRFEHQVWRQSECLVRADIKLATLNNSTGQPSRIPEAIRNRLLCE